MSADLISGGIVVAGLTIALFFLRYWRQTHDRLFLMFAGGFLTFALSRLILAFLEEDDEGRVFVYTLRLLAFALILIAIIDKNRERPADARPSAVTNGSEPALTRRG